MLFVIILAELELLCISHREWSTETCASSTTHWTTPNRRKSPRNSTGHPTKWPKNSRTFGTATRSRNSLYVSPFLFPYSITLTALFCAFFRRRKHFRTFTPFFTPFHPFFRGNFFFHVSRCVEWTMIGFYALNRVRDTLRLPPSGALAGTRTSVHRRDSLDFFTASTTARAYWQSRNVPAALSSSADQRRRSGNGSKASFNAEHMEITPDTMSWGCR